MLATLVAVQLVATSAADAPPAVAAVDVNISVNWRNVDTAGDFRAEPATAPPIQRQLSADGTLQLGPWAVAVVTRFVFQT